jgi:hypothetical protein
LGCNKYLFNVQQRLVLPLASFVAVSISWVDSFMMHAVNEWIRNFDQIRGDIVSKLMIIQYKVPSTNIYLYFTSHCTGPTYSSQLTRLQHIMHLTLR